MEKGKLATILFAIAGISLFGLNSQSVYAGVVVDSAIKVTIAGAFMQEGNDDTTDFHFLVSSLCEGICTDPYTIDYFTTDDTATSDDDYVEVPDGVVTLFPDFGGGYSGTITIKVNGDLIFESNESFFVHLGDCSIECSFLKTMGEGIIINDDLASQDDAYVVMGTFGNEEPDNGSLASVDLVTGVLTQIGDAISPQVEMIGLSGLAINSAGQFFVTAVNEGPPSRLLEIDKNTGAIISDVGNTFWEDEGPIDVKIRDLSFQPGTDILFGIGSVSGGTSNGLFTIDTSTAQVDIIGVVESSKLQGLAFAPDGTLYATNDNCDLVTLLDNIESPEVQTFVVELDRCYDGLGIDSAGQIFGTTNNFDSLHLINPEDGSDVTVAGEGTNPSDVAFTSSSAPPLEVFVTGGDDGVYQSPTLGKLNNGRLILSNGFCFDLFCLDVLEYFNHLPIQQVDSGSTHTISLTAHCASGSNRCNYASIGAAPPGTDINSVDWNVILKRIGNSDDWEVIKNDQNAMLGDVTGIVQIIDASKLQYTFNIQFIAPASIGTVDGDAQVPEDNLILVTEIRDNNGGAARNIFNEGVFVNDIFAYPQVETSYESPVKAEPLCLNEDSTDRNTCAFELVKQWTIKQAEEKLQELYKQKNYKSD